MNPSIRTFLLINLLLSVTLITSLAIIGNLFLAHKDIQKQLDQHLVFAGKQMQAFFSDDVNQRNLKIVQKRLNQLFGQQKQRHPTKEAHADTFGSVNNHTAFQIWNTSGTLLLRSPFAPYVPFSKQESGLSTQWIGGQAWRVYTTVDLNHQLIFMVAEHSNYRQRLENKLTQDSILIMLITYPFLGFLIWVIVGRGLDALNKVTEQVKHRAPTYLKPVNLQSVPAEIEPLVSGLNKLFSRLKDAFEREKRFTADAAHELKTPIAALSAHAQIALRAETTAARNQALLKLLSGVNRSTHVIQQLLTLSRMDPEKPVKDDFSTISLTTEAAEIAAELAPEAIAKNIELELIAPNDKIQVYGNKTAIHILLRNLVDNAIRYSNKDGFVKISITESKHHVILTVIDNGPGIPTELRERVFERFFRIPGTQVTGSGLGLGIVYRIVKLHNASIQLQQPEAHRGLQVTITFPKV